MDGRYEIGEAILWTVYAGHRNGGLTRGQIMTRVCALTRATTDEIHAAFRAVPGIVLDDGYYLLDEATAKAMARLEPPQPQYCRLEWDCPGCDGDQGIDMHFEQDYLQQVDPFF